MDAFESLVRLLMERDNYWMRQSQKVELTKDEKRRVGKPSMPRPEIDLLAFSLGENRVIALGVKSYLDSGGVRLDELRKSHAEPQGRYKLFTCQNYRRIVFKRLREDLLTANLINEDTQITLGLAAGRVYRNETEEIARHLDERGFFFLGPEEIKDKVEELASTAYENDPFIITAKVALR